MARMARATKPDALVIHPVSAAQLTRDPPAAGVARIRVRRGLREMLLESRQDAGVLLTKSKDALSSCNGIVLE